MARFTVRNYLREATAPFHDRVDAVFGAFDLGNRAGYAAFLRTQAAAQLPVEAALKAAGVGEILSDWDRRARSAALRADLTDLEVAEPVLVAVPDIVGTAAILGSVYVLEGSRLGGAMLKRAVPPELPGRFLGSVDSGLWRDLLAQLDGHLTTAEAQEAARSAAMDVFAAFERAGRAFFGAETLERNSSNG